MILKRKGTGTVATTALMILRNQLSERVWGSHGVRTLPNADRPSCRRSSVERFSVRRRMTKIIQQEACPSLTHSIVHRGSIRNVGIIGDSISDEYRFYAPDRVAARNWVEILAATRGFHFGDSATTSGTPRNWKFGYNWSLSGATTTSLIAQGQHTGLANQVARGAAIDLAAVTIGSNDFAHVLFTSRSVAALDAVLDQASSNIAMILNSLLGISPMLKLSVFTAVDLRASPLVRGTLDLGLISPRLADAYGAAIAAFNDGIRNVAAIHSHRVVTVDINELLRDVVEAREFAVGSLEVDRLHAGNEPHHLFLSDGFHPGTIGQCLIANRFLQAINAGFDGAVPLLGSNEMVRVASSVPRPSGLSLIGAGVLALLGYGRCRPRAA